MTIGRALKSLREDGVHNLGSGYAFHNMHAFFHPSDATYKASKQFNDWLNKVIVEEHDLPKLKDWETAPGARVSHPREVHLLPLFVVAGATDATDEHAQLIFDTRLASQNDHAVMFYLFST